MFLKYFKYLSILKVTITKTTLKVLFCTVNVSKIKNVYN